MKHFPNTPATHSMEWTHLELCVRLFEEATSFFKEKRHGKHLWSLQPRCTIVRYVTSHSPGNTTYLNIPLSMQRKKIEYRQCCKWYSRNSKLKVHTPSHHTNEKESYPKKSLSCTYDLWPLVGREQVAMGTWYYLDFLHVEATPRSRKWTTWLWTFLDCYGYHYLDINMNSHV